MAGSICKIFFVFAKCTIIFSLSWSPFLNISYERLLVTKGHMIVLLSFHIAIIEKFLQICGAISKVLNSVYRNYLCNSIILLLGD